MMKNRTIQMLICITLIALLCGCGSKSSEKATAVKASKPTQTEAPTETVAPTETPAPTNTPTSTPVPINDLQVTKEVVSSDNVCKIMVPEEWTSLDGKLNGEAVISVGDMNRGAFVTVLHEAKGGTIESLDMYNGFLIEHIKEQLENAVVGVTENVEISGYPAHKTPISGVKDGINISWWLYTIDAANTYEQINCWTNTEQAAWEVLYDKVAYSFQIIQ